MVLVEDEDEIEDEELISVATEPEQTGNTGSTQGEHVLRLIFFCFFTLAEICPARDFFALCSICLSLSTMRRGCINMPPFIGLNSAMTWAEFLSHAS